MKANRRQVISPPRRITLTPLMSSLYFAPGNLEVNSVTFMPSLTNLLATSIATFSAQPPSGFLISRQESHRIFIEIRMSTNDNSDLIYSLKFACEINSREFYARTNIHE